MTVTLLLVVLLPLMVLLFNGGVTVDGFTVSFITAGVVTASSFTLSAAIAESVQLVVTLYR